MYVRTYVCGFVHLSTIYLYERVQFYAVLCVWVFVVFLLLINVYTLFTCCLSMCTQMLLEGRLFRWREYDEHWQPLSQGRVSKLFDSLDGCSLLGTDRP